MKNDYTIRGKTIVIFINRKDGRQTECLVSLEDLPKLLEFERTWSASRKSERGGGKEYVSARLYRGKGNNSRVALHRLLTNAPKGMVVDHINGDTLDNRRENLRICDQFTNMQNRDGLDKNNKSGVRGVHWYKAYSKWRATCRYRNKVHHLGYFDDIEEARKVVEDFRKRIGE